MTNWFTRNGKVLTVEGKIRGCCCGPSQAFVIRQGVLINLSSTWNGKWRYAEIADVYFDIAPVSGIWIAVNVMSYGTGIAARTSYGYSSLCADTDEVFMLDLDVSQDGICNVFSPICGFFQFNFFSSPVGVVGNMPRDFQTFEATNTGYFPPCTTNLLDSWSVFGERLK